MASSSQYNFPTTTRTTTTILSQTRNALHRSVRYRCYPIYRVPLRRHLHLEALPVVLVVCRKRRQALPSLPYQYIILSTTATTTLYLVRKLSRFSATFTFLWQSVSRGCCCCRQRIWIFTISGRTKITRILAANEILTILFAHDSECQCSSIGWWCCQQCTNLMTTPVSISVSDASSVLTLNVTIAICIDNNEDADEQDDSIPNSRFRPCVLLPSTATVHFASLPELQGIWSPLGAHAWYGSALLTEAVLLTTQRVDTDDDDDDDASTAMEPQHQLCRLRQCLLEKPKCHCLESYFVPCTAFFVLFLSCRTGATRRSTWGGHFINPDAIAAYQLTTGN